MKKLTSIAAAILVSTVVSFAQGTASFTTVGGGVNARATLGPGGANPTGTEYYAQLFYGAVGTAESALTSVAGAPATFGTGSFAGYVVAASGGGLRTLTGIAEGAQALVQVRAWSASLGTDYAAARTAWQNGNGWLGQTTVAQIATGSPSASPPTTPGAATGWNAGGLVLTQVPEPSTVALAVLGLGGLVLLRRRK